MSGTTSAGPGAGLAPPGPAVSTGFVHEAIEVVNLFALVSTDPQGLLTDPDPVGFACDQVIVNACTGREDRTVLVAWGANAGHPLLRPRALQVLELLDRHQVPCQALGITADGYPAHPLRLRKDAQLRPGPGAPPSRREPHKDTPRAARQAPAHSRQAPRRGRVLPPDQ